MISKSEKKRIKKIIGHRYAGVIQGELNKRNELNKQNEAYSSGHITNVMNGEPHNVIEDAIYRVVEDKLKLTEARKNLLKKKSVATTTES
tara:strand:+ start:1351 stop:1620 length:270 start_codon:yes stop_codon:yes gene_type:complete